MEREQEDEDDIVCLDESFFINDNYQLTTFTFGSQVLELFCLNSASTDFDLTGQLVWPGAVLLNEYLSKNAEMLQGLSVIELGSGVDETMNPVAFVVMEESIALTSLTFIQLNFVSLFICYICLPESPALRLFSCFGGHNNDIDLSLILKKNIDLHASAENYPPTDLGAEKLEWGNSDQRNEVVQRYPEGFDLLRVFFKSEEKEDADSSWVMFLVLKLVSGVLRDCRSMFFPFKLELWSMFKMTKGLPMEVLVSCDPTISISSHLSPLHRMDQMVLDEAQGHGLSTKEVAGTRSIVGNLEGVIYEITL
uniref:Uncharacterized protein n=1 Tax=Chenopodium quinoa TaxID=63459 RepID=A0A803L3X3_CHEQI